jgi:hypothetical protein
MLKRRGSMSQTSVISTADGHIHGVHDWTEGYKPLKCPRKVVGEDDVLAYAVWLERRGFGDVAEEILERYIAGYRWLSS